MVSFKERRQRPSPHHVSHGKIHQHCQKTYRSHQSLFLKEASPGPLTSLPAASPPPLRGFRAAPLLLGSAVSGVLNRPDDLLRRRGSLDAHGIRQKTHRAGCHTRHLRHCFFHARVHAAQLIPVTVYCFIFLPLPSISSISGAPSPVRRQSPPCPRGYHSSRRS